MATKKISELPLVNRVSGSQVAGGSVLPIVIGGGIQGTTNQISVEDFSLFVNAYNATTSSNTFIGTQNVTGDVNISGRLTVKEVVAQYETASILFSTGSTKLGDQLTDKHEFTGSTNITGSLIANGFITLNGQSLNNAFDRIHQATHSLQLATASIQAYTASADSRFLLLQQTTQSLQQATASLQQATASIQAYTASADSRFLLLQQTTQSLQVATASLQFHSASVNAQLLAIQQTTQSLQVATASLQFHSASVDAQLLAIQQTTQSLQVATASLNAFSASTNAHIVGISAFTSSQLAVNLGNSIYTASVDSHIVGISTYTSSVRDTLARVHQATQSLQVATASLQQFTASQDVRNFVVSQVTGSLIGITNGLMAFTAALDNTYATDAQLYQLYQATRSLELHSGSMVGVTNGLMAYTASNTSLNTGLRGEVDGIEAYTASLKGQAIVSSSTQVRNYDVFALNSNLFTATGSLIGITNGLMAFTAALDSTYATDAQLYQLYAETASMKGEIAGIEAYTASLKGAAIVSSSTQIENYFLFAETASANTFYGNQTISGSLRVNGPLRGNIISGGLSVNGGVTGSFAGNLAGVADYAATVAVSSVGTTTDTSLFPTFTLSPVLGSYSGLYSHLSGSFFLNGVTRQVVINDGGLLVTGSLIANSGITGSLMATNGVVSGSQQITNYYKFAETASANTFYGTQTISGSLNVNSSLFVSSSSTFKGNLSIEKVAPNITMKGGYSQDLAFFLNVEPSVYLVDDATATKGMKVNISTGDVSVITGNLIMGTSGKGIDFSATSNSSGTMTSELLNDYEEGTWTPVITDLTNDATMDGTYTRGSYIKIGKQVTVRGYILTTSLGSITGNVKIKGLPFTNGGGFANLGGGSIGTAGGLNITAGHSVHISTPIGANYLGINVGDDAGGTTEMTAAEWSADGQVQMLATYFVD